MDIAEQLVMTHRPWSSGSLGCRDCGTNEPCASQRAADEIRQLRQWKRDASVLLDRWYECWEVAGRPGKAGDSISEATYKEIVRLKLSSVSVALGGAAYISRSQQASSEPEAIQQEVSDEEDQLPCTCSASCKFCKGECGCKAHYRNYMDFLSVDR